jgi:DNA-directed RNA polymerase subunit N (RpoN/RPB10)|tara:strand:- start:692 stop:925 length:234 start_codon:yes stop_codon:yes gene_type:complete
MIIPIKCVTCGNVLADKYRYYLEQIRQRKKERNITERVIYYTKDMKNKDTIEAEILDELKLTNVCCRRVMLTHVDVE